ncbi:hypothetical protein J2X20_005541 [Pelomonas saccharophila]|uniref:DUF4331 domain-containing protein n=1 Tax=Roseateles saccharophilus TaxID=304 RepID=A0ABU1YX65_ROSSA|nr:DUF4331 domain-containing protein [Roseateles saccharophilus]MDR7272856.1 hypothetical protein [Roseateles saccharophilus]
MSLHRPRLASSAPLLTALCAALAGLALPPAQASSHREAPSIAGSPRVDGTDFYMFRSYEAGRSGYVTLIANYLPLQDAYGGPNYFKLDPNALYEIHIDNNGDAREDITFQFQFRNAFKATALPIGNQTVAIPLTQSGQVTSPNAAALNVNEKFTLNIVRGDRRTGASSAVMNPKNGTALFDKPSDNIGVKTLPGYAGYAAQHIYNVDIPGCGASRVFVGQRQEGFAVNLGPIFDLVNAPVGVITDPSLINAAAANSIQDKNVTSLALEVPIGCLTQGGETTIGGWTTASVRQSQLVNATPPSGYNTSTTTGGAWVQVSRLGMPLVNEVVIGLPDKDKFNASMPSKDGQFATYVTNPTLPALLEIALGLPGIAPTNLPRGDLVTTFLTGIPGVNQPAGVVPAEMLRLNTAIAPTPFAQQQRLGIVGSLLNGASDFAGYPNGRRPKDDIVDISLVAVMGGLCMANGNGNALGFGLDCNPSKVPLGATAFKLHDAVDQAVVPFLPGFPYLNTPRPGSY